MPLTSFQRRVLDLLAKTRSEASFFAGGALLNADGPRFSRDFDLFHDRSDQLALAAEKDAAALRAAGLAFEWGLRSTGKHDAVVSDGGQAFALEWVVDSDYRFFPVQKDPEFGFALHPVDVATNKALAAIGREEARDIVDVMFVHHRILPLGAVLWAAAGKDPGWTPLGILNEIRRTSRWRPEELAALETTKPIQPADISLFLQSAGKQAEAWINRMPAAQVGSVYIDAQGKIVQPDPDRLSDYTRHEGARGGHWPSNSLLLSLMLRRGVLDEPER